jgi:hypothetical protein
MGGSTLEFMTRLRQLDMEVEMLRTALAALQRQLATTHGETPEGPAGRPHEEFLRAYV